MRFRPGLLFSVLLMALPGGDNHLARLAEVKPRVALLVATRVDGRPLHVSRRLVFVEGWTLASEDPEFGGISGLLAEEGDLLAVSDRGALIRLDGARIGAPVRARIAPLPRGCGNPTLKIERDSESIATDPRSGRYWVGFEWRNALCVTGPGGQGGRIFRPRALADWPRTGGPEAMTRLSNGGLLVLAERPPGGGRDSPLLIFPNGDPAESPLALSYRSPKGYRPTEVAELPDGSILVFHRQFRAPARFRAILSIVPQTALRPGTVAEGRPLALFMEPGLADNFEAIAIDRQGEDVFVWLASDDNFVSTQKTYLLKYRLLPVSGGGFFR
jgi:hypothetical protein